MHACMHACNTHSNRSLTLIPGHLQPPITVADEGRPMPVFSGTRRVRMAGRALLPAVANVSAIRLRYPSQMSNWKYPLVPGARMLVHISRPNPIFICHRPLSCYNTPVPCQIPWKSSAGRGLSRWLHGQPSGSRPHKNRVWGCSWG
jgi:hypothetical protein